MLNPLDAHVARSTTTATTTTINTRSRCTASQLQLAGTSTLASQPRPSLPASSHLAPPPIATQRLVSTAHKRPLPPEAAAAAAGGSAGASATGGNTDTDTDSTPVPPVLPQQRQPQEECWHGAVRREEYAWLTTLRPTDPQVLSHLKAENAYTIAQLAHTRQLQVDLQASLNTWLMAEALGGVLAAGDDEDGGGNTEQQQQDQPAVAVSIEADWVGGQGSLRYREYCSFGWPGALLLQDDNSDRPHSDTGSKHSSSSCQQHYHFFSVPAAAAGRADSATWLPQTAAAAAAVQEGPAVGSPPMLHFRAPAAAGGVRNSAGGNTAAGVGAVAGLNLPPDAVLLWSEADSVPDGRSSSGSSSSSRSSNKSRPVRVNTVHSLAVSPDGCYLAVTHKPTAAGHTQHASSSGGGGSGGYSLTVVDCSTGQPVMQAVQGVDGPVQWVQGPTAATTAAAVAAAATGASRDAIVSGNTRMQSQQQQYVMFVAGDEMEVHCCELPGSISAGAGAAAAAAEASDSLLPVPVVRCVFKDPQHVRVSLAQVAPAPAAPALSPAAALSFIMVHAADGLPRQIMCYGHSSSSSSGDIHAPQLPPTDMQAWHELEPVPAAAAAATGAAAAAAAGAAVVVSSTITTAAAAAAASSGDVGGSPVSGGCSGVSGVSDPSLRLVLSQVVVAGCGGCCQLVLRRSSAAVPEGEIFIARLPGAGGAAAVGQPQANVQQQQEQQPQQQCGSLHWVPVPLPKPSPGLLLEAVMAYQAPQQQQQQQQQQQSAGRSLQLLLLWSGWRQLVAPPAAPASGTTTQAGGSDSGVMVGGLQMPCCQHLQAELYQVHLPPQPQGPQAAAAPPPTDQQQQGQAAHGSNMPPATATATATAEGAARVASVELLAGCPVPVPDAFFELKGASWCPDSGLLQVTFSALVRPATKLTVQISQADNTGAVQQPPSPSPTQQQQWQPQGLMLQQLQGCVPGFESSNYCTAQLAVPASDGTLVPLSLAWHTCAAAVQQQQLEQQGQQQQQQSVLAALQEATILQQHLTAASPLEARETAQAQPDQQQALRPSPAPMLLTCYGSYGIRESVGFSPELVPLLDAGWVVAVAHVRGGGWLGRAWAEAGRALGKSRSVQDLVDVAAHVQQMGLCAPGRLCVAGSSAGGWLAASAALQQPQLFCSLVLTVPCLDPLGLMLQQQQGQIELGDARRDAQVYHATRCWAPYDVLEQLLAEAQDTHDHLQHRQQSGQEEEEEGDDTCGSRCSSSRRVPSVLIRAGLFDTEVPLHQAVRTAARLRRWGAQQQQQQQTQQQQHEMESEQRGPAHAGCQHTAVLLRVVPGGHTAFDSDVREAALKLAFLLESV